MIKLRTAAVLAGASMAVLAVGGTAAVAAGADDTGAGAEPTSNFAVPMLPNGDPLPQPTDDGSPSTAPSASASGTRPAMTGSAASGSPTSGSSASSAAAISLAEAKAIAVRAAGGGRVTGIERETEHGRPVYGVDVRNGTVGHDIDVDRETGSVLRHKSANDDGGGRDDRADDRQNRHGGRDGGQNDRAGDDHNRHGGDDRRSEDHDRHGDDGDRRGDDGDRHGKGGHRHGDDD